MAMKLFFLVNGLGVGFLLYVLANFWKEGHQPRSGTRQYETDYLHRGGVDVFIMTHPISHNAYGGLSVTPMHVRGFGQSGEEDYRRFVDELDEMPIETQMKSKGLSTR
jgi:hypothetical protein